MRLTKAMKDDYYNGYYTNGKMSSGIVYINDNKDFTNAAIYKLGQLEDIEERIPLEDIERILDATYICAILTNGFDIKIETTFEIEKVTSKGLWLKKNEYDMSFAPFKEYKKGWALTKEELL